MVVDSTVKDILQKGPVVRGGPDVSPSTDSGSGDGIPEMGSKIVCPLVPDRTNIQSDRKKVEGIVCHSRTPDHERLVVLRTETEYEKKRVEILSSGPPLVVSYPVVLKGSPPWIRTE